MNTESDWSSENRYQEPVPAGEPQRTARYSWDWPENLAPWWTPPPGLVASQRGVAGVADGNQPRDEHRSAEEPETGDWDDEARFSADRDLDDEETADLIPTDREPDYEPADLGRADPEQDHELADPGSAVPEPDYELADYGPTDPEQDHELADYGSADPGPAVAAPTARDLADDEPAGDEEAWPGVAPAAGWFLRAPGEDRLRTPGEDGWGAPDEDGLRTPGEDGWGTPGQDGRRAADEGGWGDATSIAAGAVPWPRGESDSAWPPSSGSQAPAPQNGVGANGENGSRRADARSVSGAGWPAEPVSGDRSRPADARGVSGGGWPAEPVGGNGPRPADAWSVSGAGLPAEPVVGATRALWGRAGGPGFQPGRQGPGARRVPAEPSPWQKPQGMWHDSGIRWDQPPEESGPPPRPAEPASYPRQQLRPSPLPPRRAPVPPPAAPLPRRTPVPPPAAPGSAAPPRYAGRHAEPGSVTPDSLNGTWNERMNGTWPGPVNETSPEPVNGTWPGPTRALLSAPVFAGAESEPLGDRGALRVDDEPDRPWEGSPEWEGSPGWDRSFGWERTSGTAEPVQPTNSRRGGNDTLLLEEELPAAWRPDGGRNRVTRRTARMVVPVIVLVGVASLALALLTGHGPKFGQLAASQPREQAPVLPQALTAAAFGTYPGQQQRGVFQTINRIVASGNTIVTMGAQTSDGLVRQQFFVSTNAGATWRLAPVQAPGGGQAPLGHPASLLAGGPGGW